MVDIGKVLLASENFQGNLEEPKVWCHPGILWRFTTSGSQDCSLFQFLLLQGNPHCEPAPWSSALHERCPQQGARDSARVHLHWFVSGRSNRSKTPLENCERTRLWRHIVNYWKQGIVCHLTYLKEKVKQIVWRGLSNPTREETSRSWN